MHVDEKRAAAAGRTLRTRRQDVLLLLPTPARSSSTRIRRSTSPTAVRRVDSRTAMIRPHHRLLGPEPVPGLLLVGAPPSLALLVAAQRAARRHPGPQRHAGHRLLAVGPQPRPRRGAGHVPDRHARCSARRTCAPSAASPTSATRSSTSSSRTAPTSTGRARARSSTSRAFCRGCRRTRRRSSGPTRPASGWVFQYALVDDSGDAQPGRPALVPGLVPALLPEGGAGRRRRWPRSAASASSTR